MIDPRDGIKIAIKKSGLKQTVVANRTNLTPRQLSDIVSKRKKLDAELLFKICEITGVSPNEIYGIISEQKSS